MPKAWKQFEFPLIMAGLVLAAWLVPGLGAASGWGGSTVLKPAAILWVFFVQGLTLPTSQMLGSWSNLRLNALTQAWLWIAWPLLAGGTALLLRGHIADRLADGILYIGLLPTTITSAVIFTDLAGGNRAGALFNTVASNMAGAIASPLLCVVFIGGQGAGSHVGGMLADTATLILLPLAVGQLSRPLAKVWAARHAPALRRTNQGMVFYILFCALCDSFAKPVWNTLGGDDLVIAPIALALLSVIAHAGVFLAARAAKFTPQDRIAALFCGGQKTLALGVPLASIVFSSIMPAGEIGILLAPLLLLHPWQLTLGSFLLRHPSWFGRPDDTVRT